MKWVTVTIAEAEQMLENQDVLLLDMREYHAYLRHHHPRAAHLSSQYLRMLLKSRPRSTPVIIYCYHGNSSQDMAQLFTDFGFISCYSLEGGYEAWFPDEKVPPAPLSKALHEWLVRDGCDPENLDYRTTNNETALMRLSRGGQFELVREMIQAGASINLVNQDGNNALWMAVQSGSETLVEELLRAGVDINQQNDNGATALMLAMSLDRPGIVSRLLAAGANTRLATQDGFCAEDVAASRRVLLALGHGRMPSGMTSGAIV